MKTLDFIKMHSLGNDFVIFDQLKKSFKFSKSQIKKISDRNFGIGCDQILILKKSNKKDISFEYKIYNKDGSESGQCGNGAKCVAKYYFDHYGNNKKEIKIETKTRTMFLRRGKNKNIEVDMGLLKFNSSEFTKGKYANFSYNRKKYSFNEVFIGNPHAVFFIKNIKYIDLEDFANKFNKKGIFKKGVNISIVENMSKNNWRARIYERGSGETMACGSAACAIAVSLKFHKKAVSSSNYVHMQGGKAYVKWSKNASDSVHLIGSAEYVYFGQYKI
jgi:diaminopimelate epimerase